MPSVVYGLWGIFVLAPKLQPAEQWFSDTFSFLPLVGGPVSIPNCFIAGLIMAIMILPIVSSISREVMATVPAQDKEAALALGATRWEMIRIAVLPYSRAGISGAAMLGLGRAIGETIAVTIVIGNAPNVAESIFSQGYTLAAVIANEFSEAASDPTHRAALIAAGLVLFVLTLLVNAIARYYVNRAARGKRTVPHGDGRMTTLAPVSGRRRADRPRHRAASRSRSTARRRSCRWSSSSTTCIKEGIGAWSVDFFTTDPTGRFLGDPGGIKSAIIGTILMVALASAIAIPFGIGVALYLVEYGKGSRFANLVRYFVDVMTGVPSVVFGLFVYIVLVVTQDRRDVRGLEGRRSRWRCSCCRSSRAPPRSCSTSCPTACARPRSRSAPRAGAWSSGSCCRRRSPGLVTGSLLAVARAAGETAPLLFTAAFVFGTQFDLVPADELAAAADLQRRQPGTGSARPAGVGRCPHAGRARPALERWRPASCNEGAASHEPRRPDRRTHGAQTT